LLARRYIIDNPTDNYVNKLITIAAPWLGSPKTNLTMETGEGLPPIIAESTVKYIIGGFDGAHQLLPSRAYFDLGEPSLGENGWNLDSIGADHELYNYSHYLDTVNSRYSHGTFESGIRRGNRIFPSAVRATKASSVPPSKASSGTSISKAGSTPVSRRRPTTASTSTFRSTTTTSSCRT
jgi:hypothetical protein